MSKLYQRVREARKLLKLSQDALAAELDVSRSAVAQWEMANGTSPSLENLIALARRSGMAFEYLATGRGQRLHGAPIAAIAEAAPEYAVLSAQQRRLLSCFDALNSRQRAGLLDLLGAEGRATKN